MLSVHTTCHQGKQDGTGSDQGFNQGSGFLCGCNQQLTRISNTRTTCFTQYGYLFSLLYLLQEFLFNFFFCLMNYKPAITVDIHFFPEFFQKPSRTAFILHKKNLCRLNSS